MRRSHGTDTDSAPGNPRDTVDGLHKLMMERATLAFIVANAGLGICLLAAVTAGRFGALQGGAVRYRPLTVFLFASLVLAWMQKRAPHPVTTIGVPLIVASSLGWIAYGVASGADWLGYVPIAATVVPSFALFGPATWRAGRDLGRR